MPEITLIDSITAYWNEHIHDLSIATHPLGSPGFFKELEEYRFDKLSYLPRLVDFSGYEGKAILEVGCGVGIDLLRFAQGGAQVTGVDLSPVAIQLARQNFAHNQLAGEFCLMNGEALDFEDNSFDMVYAHGVLQYTADASKMAAEIYRVLKVGGQAIMMVYNKYSWLNMLSKVMKVSLEHEDAPVLRKFSIWEFRRLLKPFSSYQIIPERFPVKSRLHGGIKGKVFNQVFVGAFNSLPKAFVRPLGWHLMAFARK
jgi:ubiquinone/menaquinone biosynthesis C-methylase UbiE